MNKIIAIIVLILAWAHFAPEVREWYQWHFVSASAWHCFEKPGIPKSSFDWVSLEVKNYTQCIKE